MTCFRLQVKPAVEDDESDDDCDLFGDDDESEDDEEKERLKQERLDAYAARKSKSKLEFFSNFYPY